VRPGSSDPFDPARILELLAREGVDFVLIGGVAAGAHGSSYGTFDVDLAYSSEPENVERVTAALRSIGGDTLEADGDTSLRTRLGAVDLHAHPAGAPAYEQLRAAATVIDVRGLPVRVASLDHLIAMKEASARTRDKLLATEYRVLADEIRRPR
jgi:predicted nucleotidyltransferase